MRPFILIAFFAVIAAFHPARADTPAAAQPEATAPSQPQPQKLSVEDLKIITDAAQAGDTTAQAHLGTLYAFGTDVPQNYGYAFFWLTVAKINGNDQYDPIRKDIIKMLTPDTVAAIRARAHSWEPGMAVTITQANGEEPMPSAPETMSTLPWYSKIRMRLRQMYFNFTVDY